MRVVNGSERAVDLLISQFDHLPRPDLVLGKIHVFVRVLLEDIPSYAGVVIAEEREKVSVSFFSLVTLLVLHKVYGVGATEPFEMRLQVPLVYDVAFGVGIVDPEAADDVRVELHGIDEVLKPCVRGRQSVLRDKDDVIAGPFGSAEVPCLAVAEFRRGYLIELNRILPDDIESIVGRSGIDDDDFVCIFRLLAEDHIQDLIEKVSGVLCRYDYSYIHLLSPLRSLRI